MFSRFPMTALMFSLALSSLLPTAHAAKIYHWVDDKGQPHYSENPPRDMKSKALNVKAAGTGSPGSSAATSAAKADTKAITEKDNENNKEESLTSEHSPEDKAKYCQQSHDLLAKMNGNTQRRFKQADGSYRRLEQAEIVDYKAQAQAGIESYCK